MDGIGSWDGTWDGGQMIDGWRDRWDGWDRQMGWKKTEEEK